jgi:hypothetical protein
MNRIRIAVTLTFFLLFVGFAYAQEPQEQPKPHPEEARPEAGREAAPPAHQTQEEAKPSRQEEAKPPKAEKQESPKASQESQPAHAEKGQERESQPAHEEKGQMNQQQRAAQQNQQGRARPAGKSAHIPDPKFKASFGRPHSFRVNQVIQQTTVVPGQTQFIYSGYTFVILDPWPAEWLYTDDCYIDYVDDDYYLFDAFHPGIRIALFVVG